MISITNGTLCKDRPSNYSRQGKVGRVPEDKKLIKTYTIVIAEEDDDEKMKTEFIKCFNFLFFLCNLLKPNTLIYVKGNMTYGLIRECIIHLASNEFASICEEYNHEINYENLDAMFKQNYEVFRRKFVRGTSTLTNSATSYKRHNVAKYLLYMVKYVLDNLTDIFVLL
uniref:Uncharacterized protein n=1 Tax=Panulirus argus virus 1 TaxID=380624 RepID=A0A6G9HDL4_9VIRU|nr:hypothetical protein [Panulirus argus virus 1]